MDVDPELLMTHYVIYRNPSDYPQFKYVCRRWHNYRGLPDPVPDLQPIGAANDDTLDLLRLGLEARGLTRLSRDPNDDPAILEVWI